jgi:hypothetical protein
VSSSDIVRRLAARLGGGEHIEALIDLDGADLKSLLLHVFAERARRLAPRDLVAAFERQPAFAVSPVDPRRSREVIGAHLDAAAAFEAVDLSPICPQGTATVLSGIHQNNVLAAARGGEVLSDSTLALALESARRRRRGETSPIRLCAAHRLMRFQPAPPGLLPHFRLFGATSALRGPVEEELRAHAAVYLDAFRALGARGYRIGGITVDLCDTRAVVRRLEHAGIPLEEVRRRVRTTVGASADLGLPPLRGTLAEVLAAAPELGDAAAHLERLARAAAGPLAAAYPEARVALDAARLEGLGYYAGPCLRISATAPDGRSYPLADGGATRWMETLLGDRRERLVISGCGADLIDLRFSA